VFIYALAAAQTNKFFGGGVLDEQQTSIFYLALCYYALL